MPGNQAWLLRNGNDFGETHVSETAVSGETVFNHPLEIQYETTSTEGWPVFVCEIWSKPFADANVKDFVGCGSIWIPLHPGEHSLDVPIWSPSRSISEYLLPWCPDLRSLREVIMCPYKRQAIQAETIGEVRLKLNVTTAHLNVYGVST